MFVIDKTENDTQQKANGGSFWNLRGVSLFTFATVKMKLFSAFKEIRKTRLPAPAKQ